ncbi:type VII secretion protein EssC [Olsenella sp. Marseille-QA0557]|uniref:type VII secretion protein EssC n=1 Tax=Olsenella sp. Marseille-QA0557 TaxID=3378782 RepID=UPI003D0C2655
MPEARTIALVMTLVHEGAAHTVAFDGASRSMMWLCPGRVETQRRALASVEATDDDVVLKPTIGQSLFLETGEEVSLASLEECTEAFFVIHSNRDDSDATLYVRRSYAGARRFSKLGFSCDAELTIGRNQDAQLCYASRFVSDQHAVLRLLGDTLSIEDLGSSNGTFVNGKVLLPHTIRTLRAGDVVQVLDLTFMAGHRFICVNAPEGLSVREVPGMGPIDHEAFRMACPPASETRGELEPFYPAPRLMHSIHKRAFEVDGPPAAKKPDEQPAIMQMGPSLLMGFASIFMVTSAISRLMGGADLLTTMPTLAMSISMICGTAIWPVVSRRYQKRIDTRNELRRESAYTDYLNGVESRFANECDVQAQILRDNRTPVDELISEALTLAPTLMNRTATHDDFMDLRVGVGATELEADVRWPQHRFTIEDDKLMDKVDALRKNPPIVRDVPLAFNPVEHWVAGILGSRDEAWSFVRGLVIQVCALFGYQDVKIVLVADHDEEEQWAFLRSMPHVFDNSGVERAIACDIDALMEIGMGLERVLEERSQAHGSSPADFGTYYLVICAHKELCERSDTIAHLCKMRENLGISLVFLGEELKDLPRECGYVIDLTGDDGLGAIGGSEVFSCGVGEAPRAGLQTSGKARMFDRNDVSGSLVRFEPDVEIDQNTANAVGLALSRVRLDMPSQRSQIPDSLGFLEMFEAGNTNQLNIAQRWAENDASRTLQTQVGRDAAGEWSILNLHENVHGPHGLIAGTTGSGKSEFIITYILSMCVNYPPDQVAFVLIDYKGGGLAGAFDNERFVLPHLAGTITNLDGAAITRSLVSIKSELKRRQDLLNKARDITGEATVDIYKYLSYYRQGVLSEPLPHLFIIADEFAELKQQEPEFMDELISAARIGRSLGVHLILATQKPSGVVNDQIWSNSRFKVCLKVADAADSKEMIRRDDAAEIKQAGRFYLLVGFNEFFACGQSAYSGTRYTPRDVYEPRRDNAVELIDDRGNTIVGARPQIKATQTGESELNAVLSKICETAEMANKHAGRLWLNPLPEHIELKDLEKRYGYEASEEDLTCIVGEMDDPASQRQSLYSINLATAGNVLLYGGQSSGVDSLAATMLYSLCEHYGPENLALYVADLGAGTLAAFAAVPQCGGVVLSGDDERMINLIKLLEAQITERRALLAQVGGSLEAYNRDKVGAERMPHLVCVIANLAAFYELYSDFEDRLNAITRDAPRYGIHVLLTASAAMVPHMRIKANFSEMVVTSFNDPNDYVTLLGSMRGVVMPHAEKRGLVKMGKSIFEFQGASIGQSGEPDMVGIEALAEQLKAATDLRCAPIPVLPQRVTPREMGTASCTSTLVPVGFSKSDVAPISFDVSKSPYMLVLGNDIDSIGMYLRGMREMLAHAAETSSVTYYFIDLQHVLGEVEDKRVIQTEAGAIAMLEGIEKLARPCDILVLTSVAQIMTSLPTEASKPLQDYIAQERGIASTRIVACSELWRVRSLYDPWYKVLSAYGNGIWVGSGFADQTIFKFSRALPEYRQPAARSDGYLAMRGAVTSVRLVEATDEPTEESLAADTHLDS